MGGYVDSALHKSITNYFTEHMQELRQQKQLAAEAARQQAAFANDAQQRATLSAYEAASLKQHADDLLAQQKQREQDRQDALTNIGLNAVLNGRGTIVAPPTGSPMMPQAPAAQVPANPSNPLSSLFGFPTVPPSPAAGVAPVGQGMGSVSGGAIGPQQSNTPSAPTRPGAAAAAEPPIKLGNLWIQPTPKASTAAEIGTRLISKDSPLGRHYAEQSGEKPDASGFYTMSAANYSALADDMRVNGKRDDEVKQLEAARSSALPLLDPLAKSGNPIDQQTYNIYKNLITNAKTAAEVQTALKNFQEYVSKDSDAALSRRKNEQADIQVATHARIKSLDRALELQDNLKAAPGTWLAMQKFGTPPDILLRGMNPRGRQDFFKWILDNNLGDKIPEYLTGAGQKALGEVKTTQEMFSNIKNVLETRDRNGQPLLINGKPNPRSTHIPLKDEKASLATFLPRLSYAAGQDGELASFLNQVNVASEIAKGRIASGAGIHTQQFVDALSPHVPKPWTDSPALAYRKVGDIQGYLGLQEKNIHLTQNKWGRVANGDDLGETGQEKVEFTPFSTPRVDSNAVKSEADKLLGGK